MKVKVSNPMYKAIKNALPSYKITLEKLTPEQYERNIDFDLFRNTSDYSYKTGLFSVIKITYPAEYYAMPRYITTRDLTAVFRNSDKTFTSFIEELKSYIAI